MKRFADRVGHSSCVCYDSNFLKFAEIYVQALKDIAQKAAVNYVITGSSGELGNTQKEEIEMMEDMSIPFTKVTLGEYIQRYTISEADALKADTRIAVGQAKGPHRAMINHDDCTQEQWNAGQLMSVAGWSHLFAFKAFSQPAPDTIRIAVGQAKGPHRMMINHDGHTQELWNAGQLMSVAGWSHLFAFWAFSREMPGTVRIAVGQAMGPHRAMMKPNWTQQSMSTEGWDYKCEFWVYPTL